MASQTFKAFLVRVQDDKTVRKALLAAGADQGMPLEALRAFAEKHGYQFEAEDVTNELSERQLDAVTGGLSMPGMTGGTLLNGLANTSPPGPLTFQINTLSIYQSPSGGLMFKF